MTRSIWKGPFVESSLMKIFSAASVPIEGAQHMNRETLEKTKNEKRFTFRKIWSRRSTIIPQFLGSFLEIYNGKKWIGLKINEDMIGHKFGEFASTRTITSRKSSKHGISRTKIKGKTR